METVRFPASTLLFEKKFSDLCPTVAGEQACPSLYTVRPSMRPYWLFHYVLSGKGVFVREGESYDIREGQCFIIPPYRPIAYSADEADPWHYVWVGFRCSFSLPTGLAEAPVISGPKVTAVFQRLLSFYRSQPSRPDIPVTAALWELLSAFCEEENPDAPKSGEQYTALARTYIEQEYMKGITVSDIAARLHLDRSYFSTVFRQHTGMSPQQYINEIRLSTAEELLRKSDSPISLVAGAAGYGDYCNFSKMFKKKYGVSPGKYMAAFRSREKRGKDKKEKGE